MKRLPVLFALLCACNDPGARVALTFESLREEARLEGVPLDRVVLSIQGPDLREERILLEPEQTDVRIALPAGPERTFSLTATRNLAAPALPRLDVFVGQTTVDLNAGPNEVLLPYRRQGALLLQPAPVGELALTGNERIVLVDELGEARDVPLGTPVLLSPGTYRASGAVEAGETSSSIPSTEPIEVRLGELTVLDAPLYTPATKCLATAPDAVKAEPPTCVDVTVRGLGVRGEVELTLNGQPTILSSDGVAVVGSLPEGTPYALLAESISANPLQSCALSGGFGIAEAPLEPAELVCGDTQWRVDFEVFGPVGDGITLAVRDTQGFFEETFGVNASGFNSSEIYVRESAFSYSVTVSTQPTGTPIATRCTTFSPVLEADGALLPVVPVICIETARPAYPAHATLGSWIVNDGPSRLAASATPCDPAMTAFDACFDAGEIYVFEVPGIASCDGLIVGDTLELFDWGCDDSTGRVRGFSRAVKDLSRAVGPTAFVSTTPFIGEAAGIRFADAPTGPLWSGSPVSADSATTLDQPGTVYTLTSAALPDQRRVSASGVTVVIPEGQTFTAGAAASAANHAIEAADVDFLRIAGRVRNDDSDGGVSVIRAANLRYLTMTGELSTDWAFPTLILDAVRRAQFRRLVIRGNGTGIFSTLGQDHVYDGLSVVDGADGLDYAGTRGVWIRDFEVDGSVGIGVRANAVVDLWLHDGRISNTSSFGLLTAGVTGLRVTDTHVLHTGTAAIRLLNSGGASLQNLTLASGATDGLSIESPTGTVQMDGLLVGGFGNQHAINVETTTSESIRLADSVLADSNAQIVLFDATLTMEGESRLSSTVCSVAGTSGGVLDGSCGTSLDFPAPSTGTYDVVGTLSSSFLGVVSDPENPENPLTVGAPIDPDSIRLQDAAGAFSQKSTTWSLSGGYGGAGSCLAQGSLCTIFDYTPSASSPALNIAPPASALRARRLSYGPPPAGPPATTCDEFVRTSRLDLGECVHEFVVGARELSGDGRGNDNGLCESDETCLYRPDAGALLRAGPSSSVEGPLDYGAVTDVTLIVEGG